METFRWFIRILFIVFPVILFQFLTYIDKALMPLALGFGLFFVWMGYYLQQHVTDKYNTTWDIWVRRISISLALIIIGGTFIKLDTNVIKYENSNGYKIEQGSHPNDSIASSFMLYIDDDSEILNYTNTILFSGGSWFLYVGNPADTNKFYIEVKDIDYLIGDRTYISFIYDGEHLDTHNTKFRAQ